MKINNFEKVQEYVDKIDNGKHLLSLMIDRYANYPVISLSLEGFNKLGRPLSCLIYKNTQEELNENSVNEILSAIDECLYLFYLGV